MRARAWTGLLATAGLLAGTIAVASTPAAQAAPKCNGKPVTQVINENKDDRDHHGTKGDDVVLLKGSGWYRFDAKGGDDTVCILGSDVEVRAGSGNDWISGVEARGPVLIAGEGGNDTILGSDHGDEYDFDELYGGAGDDTIKGRDGVDRIRPDGSGQEDDKVTSDGADTVDAGRGDDSVLITMLSKGKTAGADKLDGGPDSDKLIIDGVRTDLNLKKKTVQADAGGPTDRFNAFQEYSIGAGADITGNAKPNDIFLFDGTGSRVNTLGGDDRVEVAGKNVTLDTGSGDDTVYYASEGKKNHVELGSGDDRAMIFGSDGATIEGGRGDDKFQVRTYGEIGEPEDIIHDLLPLRAKLKGQSGTDTLSWDCKSTVDVADHSLKCKKADAWFGGMQVYKASRNRVWKDVFHGSSHKDVFYGGGRDDVMYGHGGKDTLIGGKGDDVARGGKGKDTCKAEKKYSC